MDEGKREETELILLNATREPLQRGSVQQQSPRLFQKVINAAFICEILSSYCPVSPPSANLYTSALASQSFSPFRLSSSILPLRRFPNPTSHTGHAKMIYDRLSLPISPSSSFSFFSRSLRPPLVGTGALAGTPASSRGFRNVPLARGGFRSEWVRARGAKRCALQPCRNARIYYAL